jgi:signal transduction histidine kinase
MKGVVLKEPPRAPAAVVEASETPRRKPALVTQPASGLIGLSTVMRRFRGGYVAAIVLLVLLYYGAAKLGYELEFSGPVAAIVWLPAGVGIAALSLGGQRLWPGVLIGDLIANDYSALPIGSALGQTAGNLLEVLVAAALIRVLVTRGPPLDSVSTLGRLLAAIGLGTAISATIGSLSLLAGDVTSLDAAPRVWRTWWLGDACGALVLVPLALAWWGRVPAGWTRGRAWEAALTIAAVAGASELAFRGHRPLAYLVFPPLLWAALRFERRGATLAVAVATGFAVWNITHYQGAFAAHSITMGVLDAQLYIAVTAVATLCLAAVVAERQGLAAGLDASRARLIKASDTERRRLEQNLHDGAQQRLSALATRLGIAADRARANDEESAVALDEAGAEVIDAIDELRELAHGIHPAVLTDFGLGPAIRAVAARSSVSVAVEATPMRFDETTEATAYFVVTEALANAQRHARASSIRVRATTRAGLLQLEVSDDGVGGATESAGGGLNGLRDRVEALGGAFHVDGAGAQGTRIAAEIPATPSSA